MKEVYLLRHAAKDDQGELTNDGQKLAQKLGKLLPKFSRVISSDSSRTRLTALLITGAQPQIEERAGFYETTQEKSDAINELAAAKGITFFEAADVYNNGELLSGINDKAEGLNQLVDETLVELEDGESALIVSHDMTITPAMVVRGQPRQSIPYLGGFRIDNEGTVRVFAS
jgi:broad specificity phosphatase PhoE